MRKTWKSSFEWRTNTGSRDVVVKLENVECLGLPEDWLEKHGFTCTVEMADCDHSVYLICKYFRKASLKNGSLFTQTHFKFLEDFWIDGWSVQQLLCIYLYIGEPCQWGFAEHPPTHTHFPDGTPRALRIEGSSKDMGTTAFKTNHKRRVTHV